MFTIDSLGDHPTLFGARDEGIVFECGEVVANRFEILEPIGGGGMGIVYKIADQLMQGQVKALKIILPSLVRSERAQERFLQEAQVAQSLGHPHIIRTYDLAEHEGNRFITMEYLQGRDLRHELESQAQLPLERAVDILSQVLDALAYAHKYTVHRDLKPSNVFLCDDGTVKLLDFGLARMLGSSAFTQSSAAVGTAGYMAPEQLEGREATQRSDLYSMGVLLYQCVTGKMPLGRFPLPSELDSSFPKWLDRITVSLLHTEPEKRPDSAAKLCNWLKKATAQQRLKTATPSPAGEEADTVAGEDQSTALDKKPKRPREKADEAPRVAEPAVSRAAVSIGEAFGQIREWWQSIPWRKVTTGFRGRASAATQSLREATRRNPDVLAWLVVLGIALPFAGSIGDAVDLRSLREYVILAAALALLVAIAGTTLLYSYSRRQVAIALFAVAFFFSCVLAPFLRLLSIEYSSMPILVRRWLPYASIIYMRIVVLFFLAAVSRPKHAGTASVPLALALTTSGMSVLLLLIHTTLGWRSPDLIHFVLLSVLGGAMALLVYRAELARWQRFLLFLAMLPTMPIEALDGSPIDDWSDFWRHGDLASKAFFSGMWVAWLSLLFPRGQFRLSNPRSLYRKLREGFRATPRSFWLVSLTIILLSVGSLGGHAIWMRIPVKLEFPSDNSVGRLTYTTPGESYLHETLDARGVVKLPRGAQVSLEVANSRAENPAFLKNLQSGALWGLTLSSSDVDDDSLSAVGHLTGLRCLNLGGTDITSRGLQRLAALKRLETLSLDGTEVSDLSPLEKMKHLNDLDLAATQVTDRSLSALVHLARLETLDLSGTSVTCNVPDIWEKLGNLRHLMLDNTPLTQQGLACVTTAESIVALDLRMTDIKDEDLWHLKAMSDLQRVSLSATNITNNGLKHVAAVTSLVGLELNSTKVSTRGIESLTPLEGLRRLYLAYSEAGPDALQYFVQFPSLECLHLPKENFDEAEQEKVKKALPDCDVSFRG